MAAFPTSEPNSIIETPRPTATADMVASVMTEEPEVIPAISGFGDLRGSYESQ
jgi:hypothetical protein